MADRIFPPDNDAYRAAGHAQKVASNPDHSAWVVANAGSGKTKVLIDRVARLLLKKADPDSILCVTYTKAAANEMLERLFKTLGAWSIMETGKLREKLGDLEARDPGSYREEELIAARALFARALETPGGLRIETIHAFCGRILRRFPLEAGVPPGFSEIEENDTDLIWQIATHEALLQGGDAEADIGQLSAEAGFGGAMRAFGLLRSIRELARAFAEQAGSDPEIVSQQIRDAVGAPEASSETLITHGMETEFPLTRLQAAIPILEEGAVSDQKTAAKLRLALNAEAPEARWAIYQSIFQTAAGDWRASNPYTKKSAKYPEIPDLFQVTGGEGSEFARVKTLKAALAKRAIYERTAALLRAGLPILKRFEEEKRNRAVLDFDDLIIRARHLLTDAGAAAWVLYKLDGGLSHVLLDEAQDTSPAQWSLLNALTEEFYSGDGIERQQNPRTQFVVGDEKQSIFGFQGADPDHFMDEREGFKLRSDAAFGKAVLPDMAMSFRSSPQILDFVDKTFEIGAGTGTSPTRHTARRSNQPGLVELWPISVPGPADDANPWDAPLDVLSQSSPVVQLARDIARDLAALIARGETIWEENPDRSWSLRAATEGDILILVQKRDGLFDAIINALKEAGLAVAGADRLVLTDHIGVQDCLNLMRFVLLPEDDLTLAEIIRGPIGRLTKDDEHLFPLAYGREGSLWAALAASKQPAQKALADYLTALLELRDLPPYEFLMAALYQVQIDGETGYARLIRRLGSPARDPLEAFLAKALDFDARGRASALQTFVSAMDLDTSDIKRDLAAPNGEIRVMTAHGAKGLQAPIVVMPDTSRAGKIDTGSIFSLDGVPLWTTSKSDDTDEIAALREQKREKLKAEKRRLLYVALTRAQDRLMIYGHWTGRRPNPDKPNSKAKGYDAESWYDTCLNAMTQLVDVPDEEGVWRFGNLPTQQGSAKKPLAAEAAAPAWLTQLVPPEERGQQLVAPSALVKDEQAVLAPFGPGLPERLKRGRLIHALLQRLPDVAPEDRRRAGLSFLLQDTSVSEEDAQEMLNAAFGVLDHPQFQHLFSQPGRAEAPIVGTAPVLGENRILNGRIDRLIITEAEILIVDFKTDRPAPSSVEGIGEAYLAQMGAYAAVLAEAWPNRRIRAALVWTDGPRLMELPSDLIEKALLRSSKTV